MLKNVEDADNTLVGNYNAGVESSSLKGYYGKFHMWFNKNSMARLMSIPFLEEEGYHIEYDINKEWAVNKNRG